MKKQLKHVSAVQTAKVIAGMYFVVSLPLFVVMVAFASLAGNIPVWLAVVGPLLYAALGFLGTLLAAALYNLVASRTGGIEYTTVDVVAG